MNRLILALLALILAWPVAADAQSLAALARQEEARRKTVKPARKVYTNDNLKGDGSSAAPAGTPATAPPMSAPAVAGVAPEAKPPDSGEPPRNEAYWRERISSARAALERSRIFAEALQSRINALTTDFVNRDDPAQRAQIELERQRSAAELDRVKKEIGEHTKTIADIEEEARRAGVPPGWLR